jgi:ATP-dependent Zn protease
MKANLLNLLKLCLFAIIVLVLLKLLAVSQRPSQRSASQEISFSQLLNDVDQGKVRDVVIQGAEIQGTYTDGRSFNTYAPSDPTLVDHLYKKQVIITARPLEDNVPWFVALFVSWLPFIAFIGVRFVSGQMRRVRWRKKSAISKTLLDDPKHWRNRATEAQSVAEQLTDPESRRQMVEIAKGYERLALKIEEKLNNSKQSK